MNELSEIGTRRRSQAPPPRIVWHSLMNPLEENGREWLTLRADEVAPRILEFDEPNLVVWSSIWMRRPDDLIRFDLQPAGRGTDLRWTVLAAPDLPDSSTIGHIRYRMNYLINAALRYTYGQ